MEPEGRIAPAADDLLRPLAGDFLDVDAALGARHHEHLAVRAIEHHAEVELLGDPRAFRHQHPVDRVPTNIHAEDRRGGVTSFIRTVGQLDAAGLAAAASVHLGLDRDRAAEIGGDGARLPWRFRDPPRVDGHAVTGQDFRRLILVDIHRRCCSS